MKRSKKNPKTFKLLKRSKEKKHTQHKSEGTQTYYNQRLEDFTHIPAEAFSHINKIPGFNYLKNGLDISDKKLEKNDELIEIIGDKYGVGNKKDGEMINNIDWYQAKNIAQTLDAKLLNLPELISIVYWLNKPGRDKMLLEELTTEKTEWLDGVLQTGNMYPVKDCVVYLDTIVKGKSITGGMPMWVPNLITDEGYYNYTDAYKKSGLPKKIKNRGEIFNIMTDVLKEPDVGPRERTVSMRQSIYYQPFKLRVTCIRNGNKPSLKLPGLGLRLAYKNKVTK